MIHSPAHVNIGQYTQEGRSWIDHNAGHARRSSNSNITGGTGDEVSAAQKTATERSIHRKVPPRRSLVVTERNQPVRLPRSED